VIRIGKQAHLPLGRTVTPTQKIVWLQMFGVGPLSGLEWPGPCWPN